LKKKLFYLSLLLIVCLSLSAFQIRPVGAYDHYINLLYTDYAKDIINHESTVFPEASAANVHVYAYEWGYWDGAIPTSFNRDTDAQIGQIIYDIHANNANDKVFIILAIFPESVDLTSSLNRAAMVTAAQVFLGNAYVYNGHSYYIDGLMDDFENLPTDSSNITGITAFLNAEGAALHGIGKLHDVYYGINPVMDYITGSEQIFAGLKAADTDYFNVAINVGSDLNTRMYNACVSNFAVNWGFQLRSLDSGDNISLSTQLSFFSAEFGGSIPAHYAGSGLWVVHNPEEDYGFTSAEWSTFRNWAHAANNMEQNPVITPTGTPTASSCGVQPNIGPSNSDLFKGTVTFFVASGGLLFIIAIIVSAIVVGILVLVRFKSKYL
jgi:hypothetical protein